MGAEERPPFRRIELSGTFLLPNTFEDEEDAATHIIKTKKKQT